MKKLNFVLMAVMVLLASVSCQKEQTDPSSPVGRQWVRLSLSDESPEHLMDIGKERIVDKDIVPSNLDLDALVYEDVDLVSLTSARKIKVDGIEGDVWEFKGENQAWRVEDTYYIFDVTSEGARLKFDLDHDDSYTYDLVPASRKIKLKYHYVPFSANDLGLSVYWASIDLMNVFPEGFDPNTQLYDAFQLDGDSFYWPETDIVHEKLGGKWRMPTKDECLELIDCCEWSMAGSYYLAESKKPGYEIQGVYFKPNGYTNENGLQAINCAMLWTSTPATTEGNAYAMHIRNIVEEDFKSLKTNCKAYIRPVWDPNMK